jgi:hypothetical protein
MITVSQSLGALLREQGRAEEAESVYRADHEIHPGNGWALLGLSECLEKTGRADEAAQVDKRFKTAWKRSDIAIQASCYCRKNF